jgi:hypothetical protein
VTFAHSDDALTWAALSLETGEASPLGDTVELPVYGAALLRGRHGVPQPPQRGASRRVVTVRCAGDWEARLLSPNVLRLNRWLLTLDGGAAGWVSATTLVNQLASLQRPIASPRLARYTTAAHIEHMPEDLELLVERAAFEGDWTLQLNGRPIDWAQFVPVRVYDVDNFVLPLAVLTESGPMRLDIEFSGPRLDGGLVSPLYLRGSFGVRGKSRRKLVELPVSFRFGDPVRNGVPHYSGTIVYRRLVKRRTLEQATHLELDFAGAPFYEIADVSLGGESLGSRLWSPYRWPVPTHHAGGDEVELDVAITNTSLPLIEGRQWDDRLNEGQRQWGKGLGRAMREV